MGRPHRESLSVSICFRQREMVVGDRGLDSIGMGGGKVSILLGLHGGEGIRTNPPPRSALLHSILRYPPPASAAAARCKCQSVIPLRPSLPPSPHFVVAPPPFPFAYGLRAGKRKKRRESDWTSCTHRLFLFRCSSDSESRLPSPFPPFAIISAVGSPSPFSLEASIHPSTTQKCNKVFLKKSKSKKLH